MLSVSLNKTFPSFLPVFTGSCNFDSKTFCTYTNIKDGSDNFDWTLQQGGTLSAGTGPSADHSTGTTKGNLVSIEEQ